ncbi:hypothetical protein CBW65_11475 [Tumebacillus avium]|uniref:Alpha/beta hydrolase n=1 Tax=Tumebacillus avium TaxID=1903704 RepID=A0A1Y0IM21_9BACL|nr:hypothetical protein [Tumebacillus avium]ARU61561.1 hypothetical protein CBW65_11475 [Tumebacillus avium]
MKKVPFAVVSSALAVSMLLSAPAALAEENHAQHKHVLEGEIDRALDTDGDGLKDYFEQTISHAERADTDGDGISDAQEDADGDGLSNIAEQSRGLNPTTADSDGDSLTDYQEVYKYHTDPAVFDTDGDNLSDGTEVLYYALDPNRADPNVPRSWNIPDNAVGVTGTMTGLGDIPTKLTVRQSPVLLVQDLQAAASFDLESLDRTAAFNIKVSYQDTGAEDLRLFRYNAKQASLEPVQKQHKDPQTNTISAEFTDGGSFVVLPMSEWKKTEQPAKSSYKGKYKKFTGKAKLAGLPGVEIDGAAVDTNGVFEISRNVTNADGTTQTLKAKYQVQELQQSDEGTFLTASSVSTESGLQPTILVHGFYGSSTTWGFNQKWSNGGATPSAQSAIASYETFTGKTYASGTASTYGNIDVQFITSVSDSAELGPVLDVNKGYTRNVDLFNFEYHSDGHVSNGAQQLKNFIAGLRSRGLIGTYDYPNLLAHSKGGLISRYLIENLSGSWDIDRLVTLGTPHFGSDLSTFGDMDRDDSDLWLSNNNDPYCNTFTNSHPYTTYYAFGAWKAGASDLNATSPSQRGVWTVGQLSGSYDTDVRNRFANAGRSISWFSYADIGDTVVNIDSAMGSDQEPDYDGTLPKVSIYKRWYVFHETYGDHSGMRKYSTVQNLVTDVLKGFY